MVDICKIKGCKKREYSAGYCKPCYNKAMEENKKGVGERWKLI